MRPQSPVETFAAFLQHRAARFAHHIGYVTTGGDHVHTRSRISKALLGAAAVAVTAVPGTAQAAPTPAAPAAPPTMGVVKIQSQGNRLCLQPTSADTNVPVVQTQCRPGLDLQDWLFQKLGSGPTYRFVNAASGACLWAFSPDAGSPVGVEDCGGSPFSNTEFNSGLNLPDSVFLESLVGFRHTGQCLTVPPGAVDGTQMQVRPCQPANVSVEGWNIFRNAQ
jgi:hypothetical protein